MSNGINARVIFNNDNVKIIANSLKFKTGNGEIKTEVEVFGSEVFHCDTKDLSTAISGGSFDMRTTIENYEMVRVWINNFNNNTVQILNETGTLALNFRQAKVSNEIEFEVGADGKFTVEFNALPVL